MAGYVSDKILVLAMKEMGVAQGLIRMTEDIAREDGTDLSHLLFEHADDMKKSGHRYGAAFLMAYAMTIASSKNSGDMSPDLEP